jgi:hypothetical protein
VENITGNDNLCKGKITANTLGHTANVDIEITEEEAIALLSRATKTFERINLGDFNTKATATQNGVTATNAKTYLTNIQNQAKAMVKNKSFGREGYDIAYT